MSDERAIKRDPSRSVSVPGQGSRLLRRGLQHLNQPRRRLIDLGTLGGKNSAATAINNRGQVVGWAETQDGTKHAFLWEEGHMHDLGTPGSTESKAVAVNVRGQIVGEFKAGDGWTHPFFWEDGRMRRLDVPESLDLTGRFTYLEDGETYDEYPDPTWLTIVDINDRGQIAGYYQGIYDYMPDQLIGSVELGLLWEGNSLSTFDMSPVAINNIGLIAGNSFGRLEGKRRNAEDIEVVVELPGLDALPRYPLTEEISVSGATAVNDRGQVVGNSFASERRGFLFHQGGYVDLGLLESGLQYTVPTDINNQGQVVGWAAVTYLDLIEFRPFSHPKPGTEYWYKTYTTLDLVSAPHRTVHRAAPFIWESRRMTALDSLVIADEVFVRPLAIDVFSEADKLIINDQGQIAGKLLTVDGVDHAFCCE